MVELIEGLVHVRDALTLIAFLSLVLLVTFRTRKVPELLLGLADRKLTREQFARLIRRFMILGFLVFSVLVALALLGQVLNSKTQPGSVTLNDLRRELDSLQVSGENRLRAESNFATGTELMGKQDFDQAIVSLQKSIDAAPTLAAQETLSLLFRKKHDLEGANASWNVAMVLARKRRDFVAQARLDRAFTASPATSQHSRYQSHATPFSFNGNSLRHRTECSIYHRETSDPHKGYCQYGLAFPP